MNDRIFRLLSRRQRLDNELRTELTRALPDPIRLLRLKRLALLVRHRVNRLWLAPLTPRLRTPPRRALAAGA